MAKAKMMNITWCVEYNWQMTKWGMRAMEMRYFPTEEEAYEFARRETSDGKVNWMKEI